MNTQTNNAVRTFATEQLASDFCIENNINAHLISKWHSNGEQYFVIEIESDKILLENGTSIDINEID